MTIIHFLEDFAGPEPVIESDDQVSEVQLNSFEDGYNAGWADALKAQDDENRRITSGLAENLQDLSLTRAEIERQIFNDLKTALLPMLGKIMGKVAHQNLGAIIVERILDFTSRATKSDVVLRLHPSARERLEKLLSEDLDSIPLQDDEDLTPEQVCLSFGKDTQILNPSETVSEIETLLADFFENKTAKVSDGTQG